MSLSLLEFKNKDNKLLLEPQASPTPVTQEELSDDDSKKLAILVRSGLYDRNKINLLKGAMNKDFDKLTPREKKALIDTLHQFIDMIDSHQQVFQSVKRGLRFSTLDAPLQKENNEGTRQIDPPNVVQLIRKAIRVFPGNQKVALYYAAKIHKYITIPYEDFEGPGKDKDDKDVAVATNEELTEHTHRVSVRMHQPGEPKPGDEVKYITKHVKVKADDWDDAKEKVAQHYTKKGFRHVYPFQVTDLKEEVLEEASLNDTHKTLLKHGFDFGKESPNHIATYIKHPHVVKIYHDNTTRPEWVHGLYNHDIKKYEYHTYGKGPKKLDKHLSNVIHETLEESVKKAKKKTPSKPKKPLAKAKKEMQEEKPMDTLKKVVGGEKALSVKFKDGSSRSVDHMSASAILNVHKVLNDDNKRKLERMVGNNKNHFERILAFAHGHALGQQPK